MESGANKFRFVSPGVQFQEIDNSKLPNAPAGIGPIIIGRAERGPALRPVTVNSLSQLIEVFGSAQPGGFGGDVWRDGNKLAPTYGLYAAQAWLKSNSPLTFVRLLGQAHTDATTAGQAGWIVGSAHNATLSSGGAFGLFIIDSGSVTSWNTGTLAAVWYMNAGSIELSGTDRLGNVAQTGTAMLIQSQGATQEFKALIKNSSGVVTDTISFNFSPTSKKYIRSVFNTNPTLLNTNITNTSQVKTYFLGETFERSLADRVSGSGAGTNFGVIMALQSGTINQNDQRMNATGAKTGWFISQDLGSGTGSYAPQNMTKLFRFKCFDTGEWEQKNIKVSITDIKKSTNQDDPYGTFNVVIRRAQDSDNAPIVLERFVACTLKPGADNYVGKKVGDRYVVWDDTERRYREFGNYENNSKYVYVDINSDVDGGATSPELLPYGFFGPVRFAGFTAVSGTAAAQIIGTTNSSFAAEFAEGNANIVGSKGTAGIYMNTGLGVQAFTGSFVFPQIPLRTNTLGGNLSNPKEAYFGIDVGRQSSIRFEKSYADIVRALPTSLADTPETNPALQYSFIFSLDDVGRLSTTHAQWVSGSRASGTSFTALTGTYDAVLTAGFDRFTAPMFGGFNGIDITEKEPFNNRVLSGKDQTTSYTFNSLKRAIDCVSTREILDGNIISAPGITNTGITDQLIAVCERRADAIAIVDLEGDYVPPTENTSGDQTNRPDVDTVISNLRSRALNNSYGASYFPWVQIRDTETGASLWSPPSVVAIGALSNTQKKADLWQASAGFTRGGLTAGAAGLPVSSVRIKLTAPERDKLYEANINPIASFPNEGIVIWGQKTLQVTPSAIDRVNVRMMMNHIKVNISRIAAQLLFEPDLQVTWDRFENQANTFLNSIKARFGLEDFRVVPLNLTTTPDLQDRNIIYSKIYLKPAKAVEFFGIDFNISNSGASFAD